MIVASAIKITKEGEYPIIVMGERHHNCFETIWNLGIRRPYVDEQGFLTDNNTFLDRQAAYKYATSCGQITQGEYPSTLYSEDLW
jgi:hypothetical protein